MNADQLAEIRPPLREVIEGAPDTCATFEIEGDPDKWVQVVDTTINVAYPYNDHPEERVSSAELPSLSAKLSTWEAGKFATFELPKLDVKTVAEWIDAYFVRVLGCSEYHLDVRIEEL